MFLRISKEGSYRKVVGVTEGFGKKKALYKQRVDKVRVKKIPFNLILEIHSKLDRIKKILLPNSKIDFRKKSLNMRKSFVLYFIKKRI